MRIRPIIITLICTLSLSSHANLLEDLFGVGARSKGMGGTGVASANDFSAAYYNPAQLSKCKNETVVLGYKGIRTNFEAASTNGPISSQHIEKKDNLTFGGCLNLPAKFDLGIYASLNPLSIASFEAQAATQNPIFPLYWDGFDLPSVVVSGSFELLKGFSIGAGMSLTVDAIIKSDTTVSVGFKSPAAEISSLTAVVDVAPKLSALIGLSYSPLEWLTLGVIYRSQLGTTYDIQANVVVENPLWPFNQNLEPKGSISFSPNQAAFGISGRPMEGLEISSDLTWYQFSRYPGPFAVAQPINFFSIFVPRIGVEYIYDKFLSFRGGYQYRPTPAPMPRSALFNLLDNDVHTLSLGSGAKWDISDDISLDVDAYASFGIMAKKNVKKKFGDAAYKNFWFDGQIYDFGVQLTVGY